MYVQGDIIIVKYPFSDDPNKQKLRPAVIVSNAASNNLDKDYLVCPITSTLRDSKFSFLLQDNHTTNRLPKESEIRCNKIVTIRDKLIKDKFSTLNEDAKQEVIKRVKSSF